MLLKERLQFLKDEEMPRLSREIGAARELGDLSENAEYHAAKDKQGIVAAHIRDIEDKLARAEIIRPEDVKGERVVFGATVVLNDLGADRVVTYQVVGEDEADRSQGRISVRSPLARAMIGKLAGDFIVVNTPAGEREYVVEEIKFI